MTQAFLHDLGGEPQAAIGSPVDAPARIEMTERVQTRIFGDAIRAYNASSDPMRGGPTPGEMDGARSPAMVKRVLTSLSTMLSDSEERGLIARNVGACPIFCRPAGTFEA
jgi:hypothetical protein